MISNNLKEQIKYSDFTKLDMRVGKVLFAEDIPKSNKLLRLSVDFGALGELRVLSGIKKWYLPEDLTEKKFVFLVNLEPREMLGLKSEAMILAVDSAAKKRPFLISVDSNVASGSPVL